MRSDNVKKGPERAPNRSLFYALGYTPEELERPLIGVVSAYSEIVPGHMGVHAGAGTDLTVSRNHADQRRCWFRPSVFAMALPWAISA